MFGQMVPVQGGAATAGRKRAAVEMIAREEADLRQTARRYSLCSDDADDAYQRALEILLLKAPDVRPRELVRWTKTVVKHEALAIRRKRERLLGVAPPGAPADEDPAALIPAPSGGPAEQTESRERIARSREALRALKPAELRALTLLAAGYSYAEIGEITGFSQTKVNRCLAEGRERFRQLLSRSEDGRRCAEMGAALSAFCDGEASAEVAAAVREHLRACAACRATMRAYRATPATVAALAPALPAARSLLERAQELVVGLQARLPGGGAADAGMAQVAAAGGTRGAGAAALAKLAAVCAGTVGGAACVATGVAPVPLDLAPQHTQEPRIERVSERAVEPVDPSAVEHQPAPEPAPAGKAGTTAGREEADGGSQVPSDDAPAAGEAGAVEFTPPSEPVPSATPSAPPSGGAAGEFGP